MCGAETYIATVYPNVDCAFIVALMAILYEMHEEKCEAIKNHLWCRDNFPHC